MAYARQAVVIDHTQHANNQDHYEHRKYKYTDTTPSFVHDFRNDSPTFGNAAGTPKNIRCSTPKHFFSFACSEVHTAETYFTPLHYCDLECAAQTASHCRDVRPVTSKRVPTPSARALLTKRRPRRLFIFLLLK